MKRVQVKGRSVEKMKEDFDQIHFDYYNIPSLDKTDYWRENVAIQFNKEEVELFKKAANEIHQLCMEYVEDCINNGIPESYGFTEEQEEMIRQSYEYSKSVYFSDSFYGRFDFGYNGKELKLIEYNADTPTSLLEASKAQATWLDHYRKINPLAHQFNEIELHLEHCWQRFLDCHPKVKNICLCAEDYLEHNKEDYGNLIYMQRIMKHLTDKVKIMSILDVGYDHEEECFVDLADEKIDVLFKLYPWEYITDDAFFEFVDFDKTLFIEPMWKMLLSNKILLVELYQRYPDNPYLLKASYEPLEGKHVKKAILAREGANVFLNEDGNYREPQQKVEYYDNSGYIYQELFELPCFDGFYPILGLWILGECCGLGIREDLDKVTSNDSHFIPHFYESL